MFFESRFPVGSSAQIIAALLTNALAIATLCFCPPDKLLGDEYSLFSIPNILITL